MDARAPSSPGTDWRREAVAWLLALGLAAALLAGLECRTRDPDSLLYSRISGDQARRPAAEWIAPAWPPGAYMHGLFREHPVGLFALAGLLIRAGYADGQAAYLVNLASQALTLALVPRLCLGFAAPAAARGLGLVLQLLPLAFVYRLRANHEPVLMLCLVVALLGVERSRRSPRYGLLTVLGLVGLLLVKGLLVGPALVACAAWAWLRPCSEARWRPWIWLALAAVALVATGWAYEAAYRAATGESFVRAYASRWVGDSSIGGARQWAYVYVLFWYAGRVAWFAAPWSLAALAAAGGLIAAWRRRALALFPLLVTLAYLLPLSLSDRRAERYAYPVYVVVAAAGYLAACAASARLRALSERLDRYQPLAPVALWLALLALHVAAGYLHLPRIKLWAPDS